jgi:DNA repair/transcription protein MET18/MMS19
LKLCDAQVISQQSATVLVEFFLSRLDDQPSVAELLQGLLVLLDLGVVSKTEQLSIPSRIFMELNIQNYPQSARFAVFSIFERLFEQNVAGLKKLGSEFIMGFIHSMDGEKDPRNLMCLFKLAKLIMIHLDYSSHANDLFEVCFCYFPITFRPPPDDPYGVTADDLKAALREIVSFSPEFAPQAIPVLLEKLSSTTPSAKKDAMDTITSCLPVYGIGAFFPRLKEIWDLLKADLAASSDLEIELVALRCLREITKVSAAAVHSSKESESPLEKTLKIIVPDCLDNLREPELKYARPCGKILMTCASSSSTACTIIVNDVFPLVVDQYLAEEVPSRKKVLLGVLVDLMTAARLVSGTKLVTTNDEMDIEANTPISKFKDVSMETLTSAIITSSYSPLRSLAVIGMYELLAIPGLLIIDEIKLLFDHICSIAIKDEHAEVTKDVLIVLGNLSQEQPAHIHQYCLPLFFDTMRHENSLLRLKPVFESLKAICINGPLFEKIVGQLMQQLHIFASKAFPYDFGVLILSSLEEMLKINAEIDSNRIRGLNLIEIWLQDNAMFEYTLQETQMMHRIGKVLTIVTRSREPNEQELLLGLLVAKNGTLDGVPLTEKHAFLYQSVIVNLRPSTKLGLPSIPSFLNGLVKLALESKHALYLEAAGTIFGSIINKELNEHHIQALFSSWEQTYLVSAVQAQELDIVTREFIVILAGWITKGLLIKGHASGKILANQLMDLLEHPQLAHASTIALEVIVKDNEMGVLTKQSFAVQKVIGGN